MRAPGSLCFFLLVLSPAPGVAVMVVDDEIELSGQSLEVLKQYYEENYDPISADTLRLNKRGETPQGIRVSGAWSALGSDTAKPVEIGLQWVLGPELGDTLSPLLGSRVQSEGGGWMVDGISVEKNKVRFALVDDSGASRGVSLVRSTGGPPWLRPDEESADSKVGLGVVARLGSSVTSDPWKVRLVKGAASGAQLRGGRSGGSGELFGSPRTSPLTSLGLGVMACFLCVVGLLRGREDRTGVRGPAS